MHSVPTLVGVGGHVTGEKLALDYGKSVVVGRSRSADWSLRRMAAWRDVPDEEREKDQAFLTVSGKHFKITMYNTASIEIANLSSNGTRVDGEKIDKVIIDDVTRNAHEIRVGAEEVFSLQMHEHEEET